ncbi:unnamed protein product [Phytophthora fragariaefolia]|uniref:Histone-lysine N-methyltransferase, H3 lysine-79 specific n=1 Tax=Phytophthora fragariaefolia TaxID=1490495 RepID=A0A9W6U8B1_9STRA|nr:unnamed protein product [Phytophthora fragariaefolia]
MKTTRSPQQLRLRLSSLKRTYGKFIRDFPKCFFGGCSARLLGAPVLPPPPPRQSSISVAMRARQRRGVKRGDVASPGKDGTVSRTSGEHCSVSGGNGVACVDDPCQRVSTLSPRVAADVLASVFGGISARDIRQQAGRTYGNAGEVLATGVSAVLGAIGPLGHEDIFLDIGAGVGNVLAQVALMTDMRTCIGLEVRGDLVALGQNCIRQHLSNHPHLAIVEIRLANARDVLLSRQPPFCDATVAFANIFLFEEHTKLVVLQELGAMSATRVIVSTSKSCLRHRSTCSQPYCKSWNLEHQIEVRVSWKATPHPIYIYRKKLNLLHSPFIEIDFCFLSGRDAPTSQAGTLSVALRTWNILVLQHLFRCTHHIQSNHRSPAAAPPSELALLLSDTILTILCSPPSFGS